MEFWLIMIGFIVMGGSCSLAGTWWDRKNKKDKNFIFPFSAFLFSSRGMCAETGQGKRKNPIFSQYSGEGSGSVRYRK